MHTESGGGGGGAQEGGVGKGKTCKERGMFTVRESTKGK